MPITLNPEYNPRLAKLDSKTMPQYKYAVYYKNKGITAKHRGIQSILVYV